MRGRAAPPPSGPVHALRKRHATFAQKDYNGILKTDSFPVYSISDTFSYTLSSVTFFSKGESHNRRCAFIKLYFFHNFSLRFILKISQI